MNAQLYPRVVVSKTHMDVDFSALEKFQTDVCNDLVHFENRILSLENIAFKTMAENAAVKKMLDWLAMHYPEAINALDATMQVTATLDRSNDEDGPVSAQA